MTLHRCHRPGDPWERLQRPCRDGDTDFDFPHDRFIAAVISTLVPCSARMTVIFGLVAFYLGPFWALLIYALNMIVVAGSGKLLSTIMPESSPGLILEVLPIACQFHWPAVSAFESC